MIGPDRLRLARAIRDLVRSVLYLVRTDHPYIHLAVVTARIGSFMEISMKLITDSGEHFIDTLLIT